MSSIFLPLFIASGIDAIDHVWEGDVGWAVWKGLALKATAVQIGDKYESLLCGTRIYEILMPNLLQSCGWLVARFFLHEHWYLLGYTFKKLWYSFYHLHSNRKRIINKNKIESIICDFGLLSLSPAYGSLVILEDFVHKRMALLFVHVSTSAQHWQNGVFYLNYSFLFLLWNLRTEIIRSFLLCLITLLY